MGHPAVARIGGRAYHRDMRRSVSIILSCITGIACALIASPAVATPGATVIAVTATSGWKHASPDPSGIAYLPSSHRFIVVDGEVEEMAMSDGRNAWSVNLDGSARRSWSTLPTTSEPTDVAIRGNRTLFLTDDRLHRVFIWSHGRDRRFGTADDLVRSFKTDAFGGNDPEGVAYGGGALFVANGEDGSDPRVYRITPGRNGRFDGAAPAGDDRIRSFSTAPMGLSDPEGITYDASSDTLLVISRSDDVIVRVTPRGRLVGTIDLSSLGIRNAAGITLAPANDDPTQTDAYVVDRGVDNKNDPSENDGRLFELRFLA
jgi:hypothetical protein